MNFTLKKTKGKEIAIYKSLYIKENLVQKLKKQQKKMTHHLTMS